jgi:transcriptional regulator GlxA family with amidase domain
VSQCYGFLLVPNFTHIGFAAAIEPLRMANMVNGGELFQMVTISSNGAAVAGSNGVRVLPDCALQPAPAMNVLFVCGPNPLVYDGDKDVISWLRRLSRQRMALGGICTGSHILARAGLLDGYRCTIHWEDREQLIEEFPHIIVSPNLFELDRDRYTCSGGTAAVDMMLELISQLPDGKALAVAVSELMVCERIRSSSERQRVPLQQQLGTLQPKLTDAVTIMEANLEEPIAMDELARYIGLSRRQLERLFRDHLHSSPGDYYLRLRLQLARQLLRKTARPVAEVALSCGFISSSHFTTRYRKFYGVTPSLERRTQ